MFDDYGNIETNSHLKINSLNKQSLSDAAWSGRAGPLQRPIAMLSFALNYYFANNQGYFSFKLTNVVIQALCGFTLWLLLIALFNAPSLSKSLPLKKKTHYIAAFIISTLWLIHPINVTSVLYIVQRMTSLSTLFTLICLLFYIKLRITNKPSHLKLCLYISSCITSFFAAIFSKENALLIPLYLVLIEWCFFYDKTLWQQFLRFHEKNKKTIYIFSGLLFSILILYTLGYASNGYGGRTFTLTERVLTETRVMCFYLSLIILPRINAFGLFHDDIPISTSLLQPWTTLPSIFVIVALISFAIYGRKSKPLISFGILFFFTGHLLESTIFGLEIAHEHRNHLPSIGIIVALVGLIIHHKQDQKKHILTIASLFFIIYGGTTTLRAYEWKDPYSLAKYEAIHHPRSPATLTMLSTAAYRIGHIDEALSAILEAEKIDPSETSYSISHASLLALSKHPIPDKLQESILQKLRDNHLTASTQITISHISKYIQTENYKPLRQHYIAWLQQIISKLNSSKKASIFSYFLAKAYLTTGNTIAAINAHQQAFNLDKEFLNPLFEMGNIFLALKQADNARIVLAQIEQANANPSLHRHYDKHIDELRIAIAKIEQ